MLPERSRVDVRHIPHEGIVSGGVFEEIGEVLLPGLKIQRAVDQGLPPGVPAPVDLRHDPLRLPGIVPRDKVVFVPELPVERRRGVPAVVRDLLNRDFVDAFASRQLPEGLGEDLLCGFAFHTVFSALMSSGTELWKGNHAVPRLRVWPGRRIASPAEERSVCPSILFIKILLRFSAAL